MTTHFSQQAPITAPDTRGGAQADIEGSQERLSILIAEDDQNLGEALAGFLRDRGHLVDLARSGREALLALHTRTYPLVITDLVMPEADGLEVLRAARKRDPATLVVLMTGYASVDSAIQATREGVYDYLRKPFKLQEINIAVANAARLLALKRENQQLLAKIHDLSAKLEEAQQTREPRQVKIGDGRSLPLGLHLNGSQEFQHADLERLQQLYQTSLLTENEYQTLKERLLI